MNTSNPPNLTVVILTLNEEERLPRALRSLQKLSCRLVVLDSHSTDKTLQVAEQIWCEEMGRPHKDLVLLTREWRGWTEARNSSLAWVLTPWVLWLDADEWLTSRLSDELCELQKLPDEVDVFRMPRQSYFLGKAIRHGGWYPDRKARLARKDKCRWSFGPNSANVHEDLFPLHGDQRGLLKGDLGHEPFRNIQEQETTNDRYSTLLAQAYAQKLMSLGKKAPGKFYIKVKTVIKFIENYLIKAGILDGVPGYIIAKGSAISLNWRLQKTRKIMESQTRLSSEAKGNP